MTFYGVFFISPVIWISAQKKLENLTKSQFNTFNFLFMKCIEQGIYSRMIWSGNSTSKELIHICILLLRIFKLWLNRLKGLKRNVFPWPNIEVYLAILLMCNRLNLIVFNEKCNFCEQHDANCGIYRNNEIYFFLLKKSK